MSQNMTEGKIIKKNYYSLYHFEISSRKKPSSMYHRNAPMCDLVQHIPIRNDFELMGPPAGV